MGLFFRKSARSADHRLRRLYARHETLAARFHYVFARRALSVNGRPNVLFLGNHSAGKSTWINYLLQGESVQDTGVAPTDDGFTVLCHAETEIDHQGPAALRELPEDFAALSRLGSSFLQRFKVKPRNRPLLQSVTLIDSPGMIDTAVAGVRRDYDFMSAVRRMAEIADLVLFFFDPDKPGTTAESLHVLQQALPGMHYKLRIILNKADTFESMHDFARAYGALCWNLARVLPTKDLPVVHTTYVPLGETFRANQRDLSDFDRRRERLVQEIRNAESLRTDNIIALARQDLTRLSLHVRVAASLRRELLNSRFRNAVWGMAVTAGVGAIAAGAAAFSDMGTPGRMVAALITAIPVGILFARMERRRYQALRMEQIRLEALDERMRRTYLHERATESREDLDQAWRDIREPTRNLLEAIAEKLPLWGGDRLQRLETDLLELDSALRL